MVLQVIEALRAGKVTPETEQLANVLEQVQLGRADKLAILDALGLVRKRGRPKKNGHHAVGGRRTFGHFREVDEFFTACVTRVAGGRGAREDALDAAARRFGCSPRSIERIRREHRHRYRRMGTIAMTVAMGRDSLTALLKELEPLMQGYHEAMAFVRKYVSEDEIKALENDHDLEDLFVIAQERAARLPTNK